MDYRYGSHTDFQIEYHFVWVTKYRYKVLRGEVAERVRELVFQQMGSSEFSSWPAGSLNERLHEALCQ